MGRPEVSAGDPGCLKEARVGGGTSGDARTGTNEGECYCGETFGGAGGNEDLIRIDGAVSGCDFSRETARAGRWDVVEADARAGERSEVDFRGWRVGDGEVDRFGSEVARVVTEQVVALVVHGTNVGGVSGGGDAGWTARLANLSNLAGGAARRRVKAFDRRQAGLVGAGEHR